MPKIDTLSDSQLVERILRRDQRALSVLYERYASWVYGVALRVVANEVLAEEVVQDTFLKLWDQAAAWSPERGKFSSWLLTIARYTAIDRLRKEQHRTPAQAVELDEIAEQLGKNDFLNTASGQDQELLRSLMAGLPDEQIQTIDLAFFQGMTHTEIADMLQLPLGTVKTRIRLGLQKLKELWMDALADERLRSKRP